MCTAALVMGLAWMAGAAPQEAGVQVELKVVEARKDGAAWKIKVELAFTNTGKKVFEVDKEVGGEYGHVSNNVFILVPKGGTTPAEYRGEMAKRAHPGPNGFIRISPGQVARRVVEVRDYVLPADGGEFLITYETNNHFSKDDVMLRSNTAALTLAP